ncbi:hypothetical protein [Prosthecobacter sp.]|uniref:hypothetical protein n=1 Tax=Prosthecobacter sp. TaxID=1965333 RepID=UPI003782FF93
MRDGSIDDSARAAKPPSRWGGIFIGLVLGAAIGAAGLYVTKVDPSLLAKASPSSSPAQPVAAVPADEEAPVPVKDNGLPHTPFEKGALPADEPVETIKITLGVGTEGAALSEPVDVHLGLGFPLRLYPLGGVKREPSFAAFPHTSSLDAVTNEIQPGQMATFEFSAKGDDAGLDALRTSRQLLTDVKCGDLQRIGFASQGRTDWVLAGYRIEVNGKLFAANGKVEARAQERLASSRESLMKILPEYEAKTNATALTEEQKAELKTEYALVRALSGRVVGAFPWYEETDESFKPAPPPGSKVENLRITLTGGKGPQQGSRNPVYLVAGGRKFLLSSEADPLRDANEPQLFDLAAFELAMNPLTKEVLSAPGVGIIGSGGPTNKVPDRAQLQSVLIEADGQEIYNSDKQPNDQKTLPQLWLAPPAFFDESGDLVRSTPTAAEVPVWKSGMTITGPPAAVPPEPPPLPPLVNVPPVPPLPPPPLLPPVRTILPGGLPPPGGGLLPLLNALAPLLFPLPPPAAPLISGVHIAHTTAPVCDGDVVTVKWNVGGNISNITSWRVDLFAVLPHKAVPVLITPMATKIGGFPGSTSLVMPPISRAAIAALLTPNSAEALYLYVQPRVTALGPFGNVLTAANGAMLPLFPAGTTTASVGLKRGGILPPFGPGNAPAPSFQVTPAVTPPFLKWQGMPLADPLAVRNAWSLTTRHGSHFGLLFGSHEIVPGVVTLPAWSTAARPTGGGGELITIRFEGLVPMPAGANGLRAVAYVAFVGGSSPATTGQVLARAELSSGPVRRNGAGNVMPLPWGAQPFFTLQTTTQVPAVPLAKNQPLLLVDMPLRFDRMAVNNFAGYPLDPVNGASYSFAAPPFNPAAYTAQAGTGTMYVTLTYMIALNTTDATDAVGVLGVRLVPDNTP